MKTRLSRPRTREKLLDDLFHCPSCSTWRTPLRKNPTAASTRKASTLSSNTAINAAKSIPPKYEKLHSALSDVRRTASPFVSLSRLQLALQGLQTTQPKIRVAVLGLNVQDTARRLVRLLLADALEEESSWEEELANIHGDQGILITYGRRPNSNIPQSRTTIPTLQVPSNLLETSNVEILISAVSAAQNGDRRHTVPAETLLAPAVSTPTAVSGRQTGISQPVHATLLAAKGLDEFLSLAELRSAVNFSSQDESQSVSAALDLPDNTIQNAGSTLVLDLSKAEKGLSAIRRSIGETPAYARDWNESGMLQVTQWLANLSSPAEMQGVPIPVRRLISAILADASTGIEKQTLSHLSTQTSDSAVSLAARTNLGVVIEDFSRNAHQELHSGLASAWSSRNWRKLAWYKLFWRVDDVGLIITDLVSTAWLPRTERAVYELCGRLSQVGISPMDVSPSLPESAVLLAVETPASPQPLTSLQTQLATESAAPVEPVITNTSGTPTVTMSPIPTPQPLSTTISSTRTATINNAINDLSSTAQQLVLRTLSIAGFSAGLSGLTYVSFASSLYEAGTIVALGTAFALYRLQGGWMRATKGLEDGLFDEGRSVIRRVVGRMRELVEEAGRVRGEDVEVRRFEEASESVARAREELEKLA